MSGKLATFISMDSMRSPRRILGLKDSSVSDFVTKSLYDN